MTSVYAGYQQNWFYNHDLLKDFGYKILYTYEIKVAYMMQIASYIFELFQVSKGPRMKDHNQMIIHHFVTLALVSASYFAPIKEMMKYGIVIMALHDISDPFLELAKLANYSGLKMLANILFVIFASIFIFTRNIIFPQIIYGL